MRLMKYTSITSIRSRVQRVFLIEFEFLTKKIGRSKERLADALEHIPSLFKEKNALKMVLEQRNMV